MNWRRGLRDVGLLALMVACSPTVYTHNIPNLVKVDPRVWRSGQPTNLADWQYLRSLGITQVVKLNFESEGSDNDARTAGMTVHVLSIQPEGDLDLFDNILNTYVHPDLSLLVEAERVLETGGDTPSDPFTPSGASQGRGSSPGSGASQGRVLVHCTHGQDRTGLVVGRYRVLFDHWSKDNAYREMLVNHFHPALHGLHESWEDFTP